MLSQILISLALSASTLALPQNIKRQASSVAPVVPTQPIASVASIVAPTMPAVSSAGLSAPPMSVMSGSPSISASGAMASGFPQYPCPTGYLLTYVEVQDTFTGYDVAAFEPYLFNWQNASYMYYINGTGGNDVGATRYLASPNNLPAKHEVLSSYSTNTTGIALELVMNLTSGPIMAGQTMLSNYSTDLQVYLNNTASTASSNATTVKLFCNFCAADQMLGMAAVSMNFQNSLMNVRTLLQGGTVPAVPAGSAMSASGMMSSMVMPSSMASMSALPSMAPAALSSFISVLSSALPATPSMK